jgi:branched-chain amino acid transport system permease protein
MTSVGQLFSDKPRTIAAERLRRREYLERAILLAIAFAVPLIASDYWLKAILIPTIVFGIAALGLNLLSGCAGLISLGQAAFMAVGAYSGVILYGRFGVPLPVAILSAGAFAAIIGVVVGIPSLRIRGLYLLVATLAAQFIIIWVMQRSPWIGAGSVAAINTPPVKVGNWTADTAARQYYLALIFAVGLTAFAVNLIRSRFGRALLAVRDHEVASEVLGVSIPRYKLLAFALSGFYGGVAGALVVFSWTGAASVHDYELKVSIDLLGMIIIGGLGTVLGSYLGAAFVLLLPILLNVMSSELSQLVGHRVMPPGVLANVEHIAFGTILLWFLIREPLGLAALWSRISRSGASHSSTS